MYTSSVLLIVVVLVGSSFAFTPTLTVDQCTKGKLIVTLSGAADGGIIYIQGQGACKQTTSSNTTAHEFDFAACGITWESSFKIIVQRKALYQTGADKQIPIMCIADLTELTVTNGLNASDKFDDAGQNLTVKPTASMTLYSNGNDVAGSTVRLTSVLTMGIQLGADYINDFDIVATACQASTIDIIQGSCAADTELFPNFAKPSQGALTADFGAFRTTDLNGGSVTMTFSCTLTVCLGSCSPVTCANGAGYGRKKRDISKRQAPTDNVFDQVSVGATVRISTDEVILETPTENTEVCLQSGAFVAVLITLLLALVAAAIAAAVMAKRLKEKNSVLKKLDSGMTGVVMS